MIMQNVVDFNSGKRLVRKSGKYNVSRNSESPFWEKYLRDLSNTLVHSRWRWIIVAASSSFVLCWLVFGSIYMLISTANGDLDPSKPSNPCLTGIRGFAGYFLFSLETQTTIGYGSRYINHHCPEGVFTMCLQLVLGSLICGLMVNIVYIKMIKPNTKYSTKLFSTKAVICRRDGTLCLIFRVKDDHARHAIGTTITAHILRREKGPEEPFLVSLNLEPHGILIWPVEVTHKIVSGSPLWDISSYDLISDKFELIVTLQGTSPTTGQCSKARTSYLSSEILWGHKFKSCLKYVQTDKCYVVNHRLFNKTEERVVHLCSAKRFEEVFKQLSPTVSEKKFTFEVSVVTDKNRKDLKLTKSVADYLKLQNAAFFNDNKFNEVNKGNKRISGTLSCSTCLRCNATLGPVNTLTTTGPFMKKNNNNQITVTSHDDGSTYEGVNNRNSEVSIEIEKQDYNTYQPFTRESRLTARRNTGDASDDVELKQLSSVNDEVFQEDSIRYRECYNEIEDLNRFLASLEEFLGEQENLNSNKNKFPKDIE